MKTLLKCSLLALLILTAGKIFAEDKVLTVAVFDFESKDEGAHDLGAKLSALLNANLSADPAIIIVERTELAKALGEQELGLSGTVSSDTAAKVGHLTGAQVLVTGRIFRADSDLYLVAKIVGTETSRVYGELVKAPAANAALGDLAADLAKKISHDITTKSDTLVSKEESRDQRIEKIVKAVADGPHPSVSVHLAERHFGGPTIDPAAETELNLILQKAGFTVVDEKADTKADIEITGEAFSAFGLRKGNLISCRSRIELKAHGRKSGKLLVVDSQTSVAVDISEQIAAKNALENAAVDIAARILPKLTKP